MGNTHSSLKHYFYVTGVTNMDLPLVPFIHVIVGYNGQSIGDISPLTLKEILKTQDLTLEILDILLEKRFVMTIPKFEKNNSEQRLGINIIKINTIPVNLKIKVLAIKESSETDLKLNDQIIGIEKEYSETEDEFLMNLRGNTESRIIVVRDGKAMIVVNKAQELGCEIGMGIIYSLKKEEITMSEYTGKILKVDLIDNKANLSVHPENGIELSKSDLNRNNEESDQKYMVEGNKIQEINTETSNVKEIGDKKLGEDTCKKDSEICDLTEKMTDLNLETLKSNENEISSVQSECILKEEHNSQELKTCASDADLKTDNLQYKLSVPTAMAVSNKPEIKHQNSINENQNISQKTKDQLEKRTASYVYKSPRNLKKFDDVAPLAVQNTMLDQVKSESKNDEINMNEANNELLNINESKNTEEVNMNENKNNELVNNFTVENTEVNETECKNNDEKLVSDFENSGENLIESKNNELVNNSTIENIQENQIENKNADDLTSFNIENTEDKSAFKNNEDNSVFNNNEDKSDIQTSQENQVERNINDEKFALSSQNFEDNQTQSDFNINEEVIPPVEEREEPLQEESERRIYEEANIPRDNSQFTGQKVQNNDIMRNDGHQIIAMDEINDEGRISDELFDKMKENAQKAENLSAPTSNTNDLKKLFDESDDSLPFDSPKNASTSL